MPKTGATIQGVRHAIKPAATGVGTIYVFHQAGQIAQKINDLYQVVLPKTAEIDNKIGETITKVPAGDVILKPEEFKGKFWSKVFGIEAKDQKQFRQERNIPEPTYIQEQSTQDKWEQYQTIQTDDNKPIADKFDQIGYTLGGAELLLALTIGGAATVINHKRYKKNKLNLEQTISEEQPK
tara:strand:+ start:136 stop:678 length:543 start_codon:yes stop_codon:yes gene_type:complete